MSCIERCPHFRVNWDTASVLNTEMSFFQGCTLRGVPLYILEGLDEACKRSTTGQEISGFSVTAAVHAATTTSSKSEAQDKGKVGGAEKESQGSPALDHGNAVLPNLNEVSEKQASLLADLQSAESNRGTTCMCVCVCVYTYYFSLVVITTVCHVPCTLS